MKDYVCIDLETTGLSPRDNEIIEIGAVKVQNNQIVDVFHELIKPKGSIPSRITSITGITNAMVRDKEDISRAFPRFISFLGKLPLLAHNINFDYGFLAEKAMILKIPFECIGVDTLKIARGLMSDLPSKALSSLCQHYNIINKQAHRATDDAIATVQVYEAMKAEFMEENPKMFIPGIIGYQVKKRLEATNNQREQLSNLLSKHGLKIAIPVEEVDRGTASKLVNYILMHYER